LTIHERREFDLVLVHQVKDSRHALIHAVLEKGIGRQVWQAFLNRVRDDAARARDRLAASFEHERETDGNARAVGPERFYGCHVTS
jgi:hypothetical protein